MPGKRNKRRIDYNNLVKPLPTFQGTRKAEPMIQEADVIEVLREVYDPELHYNIYDLGLVYEVDVKDGSVSILMTLTTPMCPIGPMVTEQIEEMLSLMPGVNDVNVEFTFNPPWTPERMTDEARADLGLD